MIQASALLRLFLLLPLLWLIPHLSYGQEAPAAPISTNRPTQYVAQPATNYPASEGYFSQSFALDESFSFWKLLLAFAFVAIGLLLNYLIDYGLSRWAQRSNKPASIAAYIPLAKAVVWFLLFIILVVWVFRPSSLSLMAFWLSLGLALGFAAQDLLKSLYGGMLLLAEKPFQPGDKIEVGELSGVVMEMGLRTIRLRTPDDSLVSIPNSQLLNQRVSNATSGEANCQIVAEIYLPLGIDTVRARQVAIEAAHVSRYIFQNKPVAVYFENRVTQEKSWLVLRLKAYAMDLRYELDFRSETTELILRELVREGLLK